ncbi:MAG: hypothetical protein XD95_0301 [Microgenomates bacterium 39_7]|nr:MAG: hypothetical protein XD95_0301 [Microgenomates bacterium 39_7]
MNKSGFTLIELLVAVGILLLLVGLGLANYISFNDRQALIQGAEQVREAMADAQNSARSGKLRGCGQLQSYQVTFGNSVTIQSVCAPGGGTSESARSFALPSGVMASGSTLYIAPLRGLVFDNQTLIDGASFHDITLENSYGSVVVTVTRSGAVTMSEITKN